MRSVRSVNSWNLAPGVLKLFAWNPDFNPSMQQQSSAQVWIRIHGLSQEYWRPKILFAIASSVGTPICLDSFSNKPMLERSFGHYARVLVDVNLSQEMRFGVLVERKDFAFFVDIEYENLPDFCTYCNSIGHHVDICKRKKDSLPIAPPKRAIPDPAKTYVPVKQFVQDKTTDNVDVNVPVPYSHVNHEQLRREADRVIEQELNNTSVLQVDISPSNTIPILETIIAPPLIVDVSPTNTSPIPEPIIVPPLIVEDHTLPPTPLSPSASPAPLVGAVSNLEDSMSSDYSEFIDSTQVLDDNSNVSSLQNEVMVDPIEQVPVIVQHEISFLKDS
jgi:hypothetical protein